MSARNRYKRLRRARRLIEDLFYGPGADRRFKAALEDLSARIDAEPMGTGADDMREMGYWYDYKMPPFGGWRKRE